jgi:hypothetical protein
MKDCVYVLQFADHAVGCCEYVVVPCSLLSIEIITCVVVLSIYCLLCNVVVTTLIML